MRLRRIIQDYDRMGGEIYYRKDDFIHDPELLEAYECGRKAGWREAMEEADGYHERRGNVTHLGAGGRILYRHDPEYDREMWDDDDDVEYRRRRRNGRFY